MSTGWIVIGVIVILVLFAVAAYNRLVALGQRVSQAFADIDVQLKQRHDLIPNLLETVKGYAAHERGTLDDVVKARNAAMSAQGPGQVAAAENQLSGALGKLIALSEAYPDLKANANFQQLANELSDLENKIAAQPPLLQQRGSGIQHRHPADARRVVRRHVRLYPQGFLRSRRQQDRSRGGADGQVLTLQNWQSSASWPRMVFTRTSPRTNFVRCCCSPGCSS
jgi:LemA protein